MTFFTSLLGGAIGATIPAFFAYYSFTKQRLYDKKLDAYLQILNMLHNYKVFTGTHLRELSNKSSKPETEMKLKALHLELARSADLGSFLVSNRAEKILERALSKLSRLNSGEDFG